MSGFGGGLVTRKSDCAFITFFCSSGLWPSPLFSRVCDAHWSIATNQIPPRPGHDPKVPCPCAFPDRFRRQCTFSPMICSPESHRYVIHDFSETKASDNPTNRKARLLCDAA